MRVGRVVVADKGSAAPMKPPVLEEDGGVTLMVGSFMLIVVVVEAMEIRRVRPKSDMKGL